MTFSNTAILQPVYCYYQQTCSPGYLTDHHNREGQALLSYGVHPDMNVDDLKQGLWNKIAGCDLGIPEAISDDELKLAIDHCLSEMEQRDIDLMLSNIDFDDEALDVYAYFYLDWVNYITLSFTYNIKTNEFSGTKTGVEVVQWAVELGYKGEPQKIDDIINFLAKHFGGLLFNPVVQL